ncbi:MAG TPA: MBL fold metallo-hydrolase [Bacteroidota bacterium]|nr:MBL fold metallo-hydrolase [Bacteroidota bacterium]
MHLRVLGSSSAGNCTLIWNGESTVMVDCGFGRTYLRSGLESLDLDIPPIAGLLITHAHADHVNDLSVDLLLQNRIPVYVRRELTKHLRRMYSSIGRAAREGLLVELAPGGGSVGSLGVDSFPVHHDSPGGCFGFGITDRSGRDGAARVAIATDLGFTEEALVERFCDARAIVIESNHDLAMLENSGRPAWLKKRIREIGHLSNDQCAEFVGAVVRTSGKPPEAVVLAHISQQCNTNELAERATSEALARDGCSHVRVVQTFRAKASEIVSV